MHEFVPLPIARITQETADAISLHLAVPEAHRHDFRYKPGQHLAFRATLGGEEVRRTYSICSGPDEEHLAVAIKRIPGGLFSNWACEALKAGMTIDAMPPAGRFVLPETAGANDHILAFAAGAGITPIIAMAEHALRRRPGTRFTLVYGNRDVESIMFRERLEDLKDTHVERMTLVHVLSRNEESDAPLLEGRITGDKIAAFAQTLFRVGDVDDAFLCGPGSMIRDVRNALFSLGMARERVHHEFFAAGGGAYRTPAPPMASGPTAVPERAGATEVVAVIDGARRRFTARPGEAIVDAALRAGIRAPYACKGGMCSTCRARVTEGRVAMRVNYSLEPWELEQGFALTCQAVPETDRVVVDYDQM